MPKAHLAIEGKAVCGSRNPKVQVSTKAAFEEVRPVSDQCVRCWTKIAMEPGRYGS